MTRPGITVIPGKKAVSYKAIVDGPPHPDGRRRQLTKTFRRESDAVAWRHRIAVEVDRGAWVDDCDYPLAAVFELSVQSRLAAGTIGENTIAGQRSALHAQFGPLLTMPVNRITPALIERCLAAERARGISGATLNKSFSILRGTFRFLVKRGELARNPTEVIAAPKIDTARKDGWSLEEIRHFLDSERARRSYPLWVLLLGTGLRRGEVQALRWRDVCFETATLRIAATMTRGIDDAGHTYKKRGNQTKMGQARVIPLMADVTQVLRVHRRHAKEEAVLLGIGWDEARPVFAGDDGLSVLTDKVLATRLDRAIADAGVRRLTPHGLRHTFASRAVGLEIPLPMVADWLGHAKLETTKRYVHPNAAEQRRQVERLGDVLRLGPAIEEENIGHI